MRGPLRLVTRAKGTSGLGFSPYPMKQVSWGPRHRSGKSEICRAALPEKVDKNEAK